MNFVEWVNAGRPPSASINLTPDAQPISGADALGMYDYLNGVYGVGGSRGPAAGTTPIAPVVGTGGTANTSGSTPVVNSANLGDEPRVTPGMPQGPNQIGVTDLGGDLVLNPDLLRNDDNTFSENLPGFTPAQTASGDITNNAVNPNTPLPTAQTVGTTAQTGQQTATAAAPVQTATTQQDVAANQMTAAQGQVSNNSQVTAPQFDVAAIAAGTDAEGVGAAIKQAAQQNISNIIDTTSIAGRLLADQLGEGNYTDSKATVKGQLDILQAEFVGPDGEPKIPAWAAATARNVSRIAAFKGMTGTASVAAMSQALMEASIPIAQEDAKFFQTLTIENLNNRQEATINAANVLAKMSLTNMDMRMTAAVENADKFLKMDLANLDNEQQSRIINNQARVQSILEDAKAENTNRLFMAESQNEKDKFYAQLNTSIDQFNANQTNQMAQFNAGETNSMAQFNANLENSREQFYRDLQFQIDTANARWRQTVTLTEQSQSFEAAANDVRANLDISMEQLNQLWDRADSLLDHIWQTAENEADRRNALAAIRLQSDSASAVADSEGFGSILGSVLGAGASHFFDWLF